MYILGINAYHADASAALFRDGVLLAAIEEERFRRIKHWVGFPSMAIEFCLKEAGIALPEVAHIAIGRDPKAKYWRKIGYLLQHPHDVAGLWKRWQNKQQVSSMEAALADLGQGPDQAALRAKIHQVEHHRAHLASAFFASPFDSAALLSIDGSGDFSTAMTGIGRGTQMEILDSLDFPHSLGLFYTAFTQFLGFPHYGDEYKIMGLAPYGEALYVDKIGDLVEFTPDGLFRLRPSYFRRDLLDILSYEDNIPRVQSLYSEYFCQQFGAPRKKDDPLSQYHRDLAASVQRFTEMAIFRMLGHLHQKTGLTRLCLAGGVAQNSVANGKLSRNTPFKEIYIPSAGHDAGISMGAALYVHHQVLRQSRGAAIWSAYTGSHFSNEAIEACLKARNITYVRHSDESLFDLVSTCLANGSVVGWFSGRSEFGPRALGGRSILADPRRNDAKDLLNAKIKRRESFRPFAPSILEEYVAEYFEVDEPVPFMEKVFPIRQEKRAAIPAVTHVDGSGRLQSVNKAVSPRYYQLIDAFRQKTGVPILLNTSFNENEPIVNTPEEALACYLRTNMDMLVLENCVVSRL